MLASPPIIEQSDPIRKQPARTAPDRGVRYRPVGARGGTQLGPARGSSRMVRA